MSTKSRTHTHAGETHAHGGMFCSRRRRGGPPFAPTWMELESTHPSESDRDEHWRMSLLRAVGAADLTKAESRAGQSLWAGGMGKLG